MQTIYKRIFEVHIIQTHYLDFAAIPPGAVVPQGQPPLEPAPYFAHLPENQALILSEEVVKNRYNIQRDLSIYPTDTTEKQLRQDGLIWRSGPLGLFAGLEVNLVNNNFLPTRPIKRNRRWTFFIRVKNPDWFLFTNHAMHPTLPARYYFTNRAENGRAVPILSVDAPDFSNSRTWEMGAIGQSNGNTYMLKKTTASALDANFQLPLDPNTRWVTQADQIALPKRFRYRFDPIVKPVAQAKFTLFNADGEAVKTIEKSFTTPSPGDILLDFTAIPAASATQQPTPIPDGRYTLEVSVNGQVFESPRIVLRSEIPNDPTVIGMIEMEWQDDDAYRLINTDNTLPGQVDPVTGRWRSNSIFQIRFMPRHVYPQFHFLNGTNTVSDHTAYDKDPHKVRLKSPVPLLKTRQPLTIKVNNIDKQMPNPEYEFQLLPEWNDTVPEVFVSEIKLRSP